MSLARLFSLTVLALLAFAGNSVLCRLALAHNNIDAATFTMIRLFSGALVLWLCTLRRREHAWPQGHWLSALLLFVYAAGFSFAYLQLDTGMGALLLFGAVQLTMVGFGFIKGERFSARQWSGFVLALVGVVGLLSPGLSAPPLGAALLMLFAGVAWGGYSILGKRVAQPLEETAGNFVRALPFSLLLIAIFLPERVPDNMGTIYAVFSGALTSGLGYAIWYSVLPLLRATTAATLQLSVPVLAAIAGIVLLNESPTLRLVIATAGILGGIALVLTHRKN